STKESTVSRDFNTLDLTGRIGPYARHLKNEVGIKDSPQLAEGNKYLLYSYSRWNLPPELYSFANDMPGTDAVWWPQRLTETIPESFARSAGYRPRIQLVGRDRQI